MQVTHGKLGTKAAVVAGVAILTLTGAACGTDRGLAGAHRPALDASTSTLAAASTTTAPSTTTTTSPQCYVSVTIDAPSGVKVQLGFSAIVPGGSIPGGSSFKVISSSPQTFSFDEGTNAAILPTSNTSVQSGYNVTYTHSEGLIRVPSPLLANGAEFSCPSTTGSMLESVTATVSKADKYVFLFRK